jgi:SAM-dependent methyltransferase
MRVSKKIDAVRQEKTMHQERKAVSSRPRIEADYDAVAPAYAKHLASELMHKPFDRSCLDDFAGRWIGRGVVADLGCGPGHVTAYLAAHGVTALGLDISSGMIAEARRMHPSLAFEEGNILTLGKRPSRFAAAVAFYALVHFDDSTLQDALASIRTALAPGGEFLAAVHVGADWLEPEQLWGIPVGLRFRMFEPGRLEAALHSVGFRVLETLQRDPYPGVEYPSQRAYIRATI